MAQHSGPVPMGWSRARLMREAWAYFRENPKFMEAHVYVEDKHGVCAHCGEGMMHVWYDLLVAGAATPLTDTDVDAFLAAVDETDPERVERIRTLFLEKLGAPRP